MFLNNWGLVRNFLLDPDGGVIQSPVSAQLRTSRISMTPCLRSKHHILQICCCKTVTARSYRDHVEFFFTPKGVKKKISWHCPFKTKFKYFNLHFKFKNLSPPNIPLSSHRIFLSSHFNCASTIPQRKHSWEELTLRLWFSR